MLFISLLHHIFLLSTTGIGATNSDQSKNFNSHFHTISVLAKCVFCNKVGRVYSIKNIIQNATQLKDKLQTFIKKLSKK